MDDIGNSQHDSVWSAEQGILAAIQMRHISI
jgi:hypothetical protein